jgi:peptidoglycan/xylan/chitin deacetylase (PgdA/CDA1 family)
MLKLPGHARYGYSPIVARADYTWPGGKRLAFYVALNIEHFAFGTGIGMDPVRSGQQTTRNFAWRDYGNRVGNWRLFEMLDELKLPATILLNSSVCDNYPQIVDKIKARGDDVMGHGRTNAELLRGMWEADEARAIAECTDVIEKHVGVRPTGGWGRERSKAVSLRTCSRKPAIPISSTGRSTTSRSGCRRVPGRCYPFLIRWSSTMPARWRIATIAAANSPT